MTKDQVLAKIRKEYKWYQSPKKSDRVDIPEDVWQSIGWTPEEIEINCALPHHMWNRRQDDRPWPLSRQFRGSNAVGPRAKEHGITAKFTPTPPKLVKGRGISRWMAPRDLSVLEIPELDDYKKVWTPDNLPPSIEVIERKGSLPNTGKKVRITKIYLMNNYGPSSLQKFSDKSKLLRSPWHFSQHKLLERRERLGVSRDLTGADRVAFYRIGGRWDSLDGYIVKNAVYAGLAWN